jgi:hypothetical protein
MQRLKEKFQKAYSSMTPWLESTVERFESLMSELEGAFSPEEKLKELEVL